MLSGPEGVDWAGSAEAGVLSWWVESKPLQAASGANSANAIRRSFLFIGWVLPRPHMDGNRFVRAVERKITVS